MNKEDLKSFYLAVILSALVVLAVNYFFAPAKTEPAVQEVAVAAAEEEQNLAAEAENAEVVPVFADVAETLQQDARLPLKNDSITGSIRLKGARFDEVMLSKYKQTIEENSPAVQLFAPAKTAEAFFAEYGWLSSNPNLKLPNKDTIWQVLEGDELTPQKPVTLVWRNGEGLTFKYIIRMDENYLFDVEQIVENHSSKDISVVPYGLLNKRAAEDSLQRGIVHQGFTAIIDDNLKEVTYSKIDNKGENFETTGGWVSFADKYWFGAFVFADDFKADVNIRQVADNVFQLDYKGEAITIKSGDMTTVKTNLYAGAKEIKLLDKYAEKIKKFDLTVDFGWYYFLTKPFFYILDYLYQILGNMGWAILLFAAMLRLILFPIANKSFENMSKMKKVQPKIMAIQAMYKNDKVAQQRATMELYKKEKINPAAGCLPMLIQIPVFFSLYKVLVISLEIRHAPFIGWIKDLSAPDPLTISQWAHIWVPSALDIGVWPLIYGLTMYLQNKLNPAPANKDQARMFALMPLIFMFMFAHFAVGLVIYWTLSNILSMIQQRAIMYKNGVK
ncbi:MAG: membrane protein insertase YidC [Alphaproteobacteria bacterium]|nr:membrane protein insertase YidC [Alphaproteobacteria bacterium]